jgi:hypothetical protein
MKPEQPGIDGILYARKPGFTYYAATAKKLFMRGSGRSGDAGSEGRARTWAGVRFSNAGACRRWLAFAAKITSPGRRLFKQRVFLNKSSNETCMQNSKRSRDDAALRDRHIIFPKDVKWWAL